MLPDPQAGAAAAARLTAQVGAASQQAAATASTRASLPLRAPGAEAAAEALLSAAAMLAANPGLPAAQLARVEVLPCWHRLL